MDVQSKERLRSTRDSVAAQIQRDFADMEDFPFHTMSNVQDKRVVVSDGTQIEMMRSRKRYKPGDYMFRGKGVNLFPGDCVVINQFFFRRVSR